MFTTPCYIRITNKGQQRRVIEFLEEIGYVYELLPLDIGEYVFACNDSYLTDVEKPDSGTDCDSNTDLFMALAALRDDSDYMQWFTNGADWILFRSEGTLLNYEHPYTSLMDDDVNRHFHKATPAELITHFTNE